MSKELQSLAKRVKQIKTGEALLEPILDEYYLHRSPDRVKKGNYFSPSSLCGCRRAAYFDYMLVPGKEERDPRTQATFDDGKYRHLRWQKDFEQAGILIAKEKFVQIPEWQVRGSLDAIVQIQAKPWVVELKGINQNGFERINRAKQGAIDHRIQLHIYMKAAKVPRGILVYENKNNQRELREFIFEEPDVVIMQDLEQTMEILLDCVAKKEPPPIQCRQGTTMRSWCSYQHLCPLEKR